MNEGEESDTGKHLTDIQEARRQAKDARRAARRELTREGSVSPATKAELGASLADYQDVLHPYRDDDGLNNEWEERLPISGIEELLGETIEREKTANKATGRTETVRFPKIVEISASTLIEQGKELDEIFTELGFAAKTSGSTHLTEIDDELMDEVREWQKNHQ